jgi:prepilin-type N-terminal cleavage/methylation domain-containing protein
MKRMNRAAQGGFSLIELLVGLALLTLLAVAISGAFDGSRSRAQSLISMMSELGSANARLKNDTGCYVNKPEALFNSALKADVAHNWCGKSLAKTWNGPYSSRFETVAFNVAADRIADGVVVSFDRTPLANGSKLYFAHAVDVPVDIARQFLVECNGSDAVDANAFDIGKKCRAPTGLNAELVAVDMMFGETR